MKDQQLQKMKDAQPQKMKKKRRLNQFDDVGPPEVHRVEAQLVEMFASVPAPVQPQQRPHVPFSWPSLLPWRFASFWPYTSRTKKGATVSTVRLCLKAHAMIVRLCVGNSLIENVGFENLVALKMRRLKNDYKVRRLKKKAPKLRCTAAKFPQENNCRTAD